MRVLFAGILQASYAASGPQRLWAMRELGHEVLEFSFHGYESSATLARRLGRRVRRVAFEQPDMDRLGQALVDRLTETAPDMVWLEKPIMLLPSWLAKARRAAPEALFVCFQDDDPFGTRTRERLSWKHFIDCIHMYDLHFVKRDANVAEFKRHGAKRVHLFMHGVFPELFFPRHDVEPRERHDVVFVGTPLDHRVRTVRQLLLTHRLPLHVYGSSWRRTVAYWLRREHFHAPVGGDRYARILSGSKIALGFVSSSNRDEYSMRTFEIPACGAMLLAERTPIHQSLFHEGVEAEFFDSPAECADKCLYYLRNGAQREAIAKRGQQRVSREDYSLVARMRDAFHSIAELRAASGGSSVGPSAR